MNKWRLKHEIQLSTTHNNKRKRKEKKSNNDNNCLWVWVEAQASLITVLTLYLIIKEDRCLLKIKVLIFMNLANNKIHLLSFYCKNIQFVKIYRLISRHSLIIKTTTNTNNSHRPMRLTSVRKNKSFSLNKDNKSINVYVTTFINICITHHNLDYLYSLEL